MKAGVFENFGTINKNCLNKNFDNKKHFSPNHTFVGFLVDLLLNFKIGQGLLVHPVHLSSPNSQLIFFSILI